jgi:fatty acid desaturase
MPRNNSMPEYDLQEFRSNLKDQNFYGSQIRQFLPKYVFEPVPYRLVWIFVHYSFIIACGYLILNFHEWYIDLPLSILIGNSLSVIFFVGHEIAHGCVIKNKKLIVFLSTVCFAHFGLHAKAFISFHNRKHHHVTQHPYKDPDCFGKQNSKNKCLKKFQRLLPGSGTLFSYTFFFWFFSFYCLNNVWFQKNIFVNKKEKIESRIFSVASYVIWIAACFYFHTALYFFVIPLLVSNFVVMCYLSTNHTLSPLTEETNDPLVNSLTVDTPKFLRFLHLNFNYHTEHHLYPYVSSKHAPLISKLLEEKFPGRYNHIPHSKALKLLYRRPKFYYDDLTLINPATKEKYPTIVFEDFL